MCMDIIGNDPSMFVCKAKIIKVIVSQALAHAILTSAHKLFNIFNHMYIHNGPVFACACTNKGSSCYLAQGYRIC